VAGAGFVALGGILGVLDAGSASPARVATWLAGTACYVLAVLAFNSWAGHRADRLNPRFAAVRDVPPAAYLRVALPSAALALALDASLAAWTAVLAAAGMATWSLYSAAEGRFKAHPWPGGALHLVAHGCQFYMGYLAFARFSPGSVVIAVYFGIVFVAGYLNHLVLDFDADEKALVSSTARPAPASLRRASRWLFVASAAWLAAAALAGLVRPWLAGPLLVAFACQGFDWSRSGAAGDPARDRTRYRVYYAGAAFAGLAAAWLAGGSVGH